MAFFHASTLQRRDRNRIDRLRNNEGNWVHKQEDILRLIEEYYMSLFTSKGSTNLQDCINKIPKRVTESMNNDLLKEVTEEEIKQAVFGMDGTRAPRPNGLSGQFYQKHWSTIQKDVCAVVKDFFEKGHIPNEINETQVVLIPKIKQAETLNHLRPISCCNYIYKIISKVMVARLRSIMDKGPLSPYLFIIAAEVFTILMDKALKTSGQIINLEKSGITFGNQIPIQTRVNIEEILNIPTWDEPEKYLGLPVQWKRSKSKSLDWIMEKVDGKIERWKENLLNQAGKEVLIKAVIQAIPTYAMSILKFPKSLCNKLSAKVAKFWWRGQWKEKGIQWTAWTKLCTNKKEGGLGFKDFHHQNTAQLAKHAWRIIKNPEAVWVRLLKASHFPNCEFWEAQSHQRGSWIWNSILQGRDLLKSKAKWNIGQGKRVKVWKDNWIYGLNQPLDKENNEDLRVKDLISSSKEWDQAKIKNFFPAIIAEKIIRTPISRIARQDNLIWPYRQDGNYTVKTGYHIAKKRRGKILERQALNKYTFGGSLARNLEYENSPKD
ncbi:uncharacterized protein LOC130965691 [Arachis stenosperma]|uniref:uncharacterized protein LOC130965691 n=1 Tax=Arachis stenosperma TaxID=217475 RepID=UPI0025AC245D|nr:uncharacterized protein LOC130965691 [Arachis stenosperma]